MIEMIEKQKRTGTKEIVRTEQLIGLLAEQTESIREFDENLFKLAVKEISVSKEHDITFCLHNGLKLTEKGADENAVAHANRL